ERQRVALFRSGGDGSLAGMASLDVYPVSFEGRRLAAIFTSHVVLHEQHRGHNLIQRLGLRVFLQTRLRHPFRRIFWFFDTFSYKSYLLMARNFRHFWPRRGRETPRWELRLMDQLANEIYGKDWQSARGIVRRSGRKRLRPGTAPVDGAPATDADFEFYTRCNPGHAEGDMLVCLCPLTLSNWLNIATRALARTRRSVPAGLAGS
ncbi:MAG: hypothetical protein ACREUZ_22570, partial [Burkholderiales bacterium]